MAWSDWAKLGAELYGGYQANKGNKGAAKAGQAGQEATLAESARQFDLARSDQLPWLKAGQDSLAQLLKLNQGDTSGFMDSPDYQYALEQGTKAQDRWAAARGNLFSGGTSADLARFGQGLATQNLNNYAGRLAQIAGLGQNTAQNLGSVGQNYANQYGNAQTNIGNLRGSSYQNQAYNRAALASNLGNLFQNWGQDDGPDIY